GFQLKHLAELNYQLMRVPERRISMESSISLQTAAIWSTPRHTFEKLQGRVSGEWSPQLNGDDYKVQQTLRAGTTFGQAPFDELFMLGLERDNDLSMRAHIATHDGRKGSAPLGGNYMLSNWDIDKHVYNNGIFGLKLSPFLDTGRIMVPHRAWDRRNGCGIQGCKRKSAFWALGSRSLTEKICDQVTTLSMSPRADRPREQGEI